MSEILLKVFLIFTLFSNSIAVIDESLIADFSKFKSLQSGYVFDCLPIIEKIHLTKFLMKHYIRMSEYKIDKNLTLNVDQLDHHYGIIVDGDCADINNFLKLAEELKLFNYLQHWLVMVSDSSILANFSNVALNINSDLYIALPNNPNRNNTQTWKIIDVYNPAYKHGGKLITEDVGFYNVTNGLKIRRNTNKYWLRKNMTGVTFKNMAVLRQALNMTLEEYLQCHINHRLDSFARFHCQLIHHCQDFYSFNMTIIPTDTWGYEISKGRFDGLTGALQNKTVDFGCAGLYIKLERIPIIDYSVGFWTFRDIFIFRQPRTHSFGQLFLRPMSSSVWLSVAAAALLIVCTLKFSQRHEVNIAVPTRDSLDEGWSTLILFILGAICQQGCPQYPTLICGRIITISVLTFCLLLYQFYSGTVVSFLLTKPPPTIKTPKDLLRNPIEVGSEDLPYIKDYFRTTKDPIANELYQTKMMKLGNGYFPPEQGLRLVRKGGFAYQVEINAGYNIISNTFSNKAICELGEVEMFPPKLLLTVLQKDSPFRDMFNYCMLRLGEHGIADRQKILWSTQKPECLQEPGSIKIEVGLKGIYPVLLLYLVGVVMCLAVLVLEICSMSSLNPLKSKMHVTQYEYPFYN